jgi:ribosomal protein S18 acetylase RimI-like enzyme
MDSDSDERIKSLDINISSLSPEEFKEFLDKMIVIYQNGYRNLEEYAYKKRHDIKSYLKWLYKNDPEGFLAAFSNKDKPIGFIAGCRFWQDKIFGEIGEIHELVVDRTFQRKGVGKKLFREIITIFRKHHDKIGLWVGGNNIKAISFYRQTGFKVTGKGGKWLRMIKEILPGC